jgi:hypothetical protein
MGKENSDRQKVTPERAIQILEFMNKFAMIAIDLYINDQIEHHME